MCGGNRINNQIVVGTVLASIFGMALDHFHNGVEILRVYSQMIVDDGIRLSDDGGCDFTLFLILGFLLLAAPVVRIVFGGGDVGL